jgi:hypothetical protein
MGRTADLDDSPGVEGRVVAWLASPAFHCVSVIVTAGNGTLKRENSQQKKDFGESILFSSRMVAH